MCKKISLLLVLCLLCMIPLGVQAAQVLTDGGFEGGSLESGWFSYGYPFNATTQSGTRISLSGDQARTGNGSLKSETTRVDGYSMYGAMYQLMNPNLSASYTVSGYMKVPQEWNGKKARIYAYYRTSSGGNLVNSGEFTLSSASWTKLSYSIDASKAPENTGRIDIIFAFPINAIKGTASVEKPAVFYLDDVEISSVWVAADQVSVTGTLAGTALQGSYQYSGSDPEGQSSYRWLLADSESGEYSEILGAASDTYTPSAGEIGKYLKFEVTPVNENGAKGEAVQSQPVLISGHTVSFSIGAGGTVVCNDNEMLSGSSLLVADGDSLSVTVTPESGKMIASVLDGTGSIPVPAPGEPLTYTMENISQSKSLQVAFADLPAGDPAVTASNSYVFEKEYSYENKAGETVTTPCVVVYGRLNNYSYTSADQAGFRFYKSGEEAGALMLPIETALSANLFFGVRVVGEAIQTDSAYCFTPYVKIGSSEAVCNEEETITCRFSE
ncbi:MAG: hypothetical protein SO147_02695 [Clostridia bacterium]|nr:hypothetical protein [Clostridia bacterium]